MKWIARLLGAITFSLIVMITSVISSYTIYEENEPSYTHINSLSWEEEGRVIIH